MLTCESIYVFCTLSVTALPLYRTNWIFVHFRESLSGRKRREHYISRNTFKSYYLCFLERFDLGMKDSKIEAPLVSDNTNTASSTLTPIKKNVEESVAQKYNKNTYIIFLTNRLSS